MDIFEACDKEDYDRIIYLLDNGVDVNTRNDNLDTPLHFVSKCENFGYDHYNVAKLLIKKGAKVNVMNCDGNTPLYECTIRCFYYCMEILIENGADINVLDNEHNTLLHKTCETGDIECTELLIKNGIDVNILNCHNITALQVANINGYNDIAKLLKNNRAENDKDNDLYDTYKNEYMYTYFNKNKLLSSKNVDEFNLFLPNPKELYEYMIKNDDIELWIMLKNELSFHVNSILKLEIVSNKDNVKNLFKYDTIPEKIIQLIIFTTENSSYAEYLFNTIIDFKDKITLNQFKQLQISINKNSKFKYRKFTDNISLDFKILKKDKKYNCAIIKNISDIDRQNVKCLLDLKQIVDINIYSEYIKWLIDLSSIMDINRTLYNNDENTEHIIRYTRNHSYERSHNNGVKYIFWHPKKYDECSYEDIDYYNKIIMNKLRKYFKKNICKKMSIHSMYECYFCKESKIDLKEIFYNSYGY